MTPIRIIIASPSDVQPERELASSVIAELDKNLARPVGFTLDPFRWEVDAHPDFHPQGGQGVIEQIAKITEADIFVGIFWRKLGTPLPNSRETGTEHEFGLAFETWKKTGKPAIKLYFNRTPFFPSADEDVQWRPLQEFRKKVEKLSLIREYDGPEQFSNFFRQDLTAWLVESIVKDRKSGPLASPQPRRIPPSDAFETEDVQGFDMTKLLVPNSPRHYTSFHPELDPMRFYRAQIPTTEGIVKVLSTTAGSREVREETIENFVRIVRDPIRPFEIQIGDTRARRPGATPGYVTLEDRLTVEGIRRMYPFIVDENDKWLRTVFAELATTPEVLQYIYDNDPDEFVRATAVSNPRASSEMQKQACLFCNAAFIDKRAVYASASRLSRIICNDYPFGPYFHYIILPTAPIHSWANVEEKHFRDMNLSLRRFLGEEVDGTLVNLHGSAGIRIGLNSSIRHLVLGKTTRSSAGASITHVHKQVWGMTPGAVNMGTHLAEVCRAFQQSGIDYLQCYLAALREAKLVLWEDDFFALYVPLGQMSVHELQAMVKRPNVSNFLQLNDQEIQSLSKCEFIAASVLAEIGVNSFNEIMITDFLDSEYSASNFRLVFAFVTREVDLAVSELCMLYVVDKYPEDTIDEARRIWPAVKEKCNLDNDLL